MKEEISHNVDAHFFDKEDRLTQNTKVTDRPIYNLEVHPLAIWDPTVHYDLLKDTNVVEQDLPGFIPEDTVERDIRYVNWSIGDTDLLDAFIEVKATFVKEKHEEISDYDKDPETLIDKIAKRKEKK